VVSLDLTGDEVRSLSTRRTGRFDRATSFTQREDRDAVEQAALFLHGVLKQFACNTGVSEREATARFGSISAISVTPVPIDFDARYSALWKRYVYYVYSCGADSDTGQPLPFVWMRHAWRVKQQLDLDAMSKAAQLLSGKEHNFEWLSILQQGELREPRRTLQLAVEEVHVMSSNIITNAMPYFLEYSRPCAKVYKVSATCDFFLYKMMRRVVGVLVSVGSGNAHLNTLALCIDAHDNSNNKENLTIPKELVETAPAHGLCLNHVEYGFPI
jgi:tRNA pseudouridine38-40 synthase